MAVITYELEDAQRAATDLADQLGNFILLKNSVGILFCDSMMDHEALIQAVEKQFPFEIVGCTTNGILHGEVGFHDACITLTVMTADDCDFQIALSEPLVPERLQDILTDTYRDAANRLDGELQLIIAYPPYRLDVVLDDYPIILGELSGGKPVFGGYPSRNSEYGENLILAKGKSYSDRILLVLIGGNVRPVFSVQSLITNTALQKRTVTSSDRNIVYRIGDGSFTEFLEGVGLPVHDYDLDDSSFSYLASPLIVEPPCENGEEQESYLRAIYTLNSREGFATLIGHAPEGSKVSVGNLTRQDIQKSTQQAIAELNERIVENEKDGYRYGLILCTSCMARYMVMAPDSGLEGDVLASSLPGPNVLSGFYGYGEICPTSVKDGVVKNQAHNQTIVLCAL